MLYEIIKDMEECSIAMRNQFVRRMYRSGKSVSEIVRMLKDLDEIDVSEIVGVERIYGSK
jgi:hypothetical protein